VAKKTKPKQRFLDDSELDFDDARRDPKPHVPDVVDVVSSDEVSILRISVSGNIFPWN
jgi:hypothetical protein